jgi:hypothetical protein
MRHNISLYGSSVEAYRNDSLTTLESISSCIVTSSVLVGTIDELGYLLVVPVIP